PAQAYSVILMPTMWFIFVFWFVVWRVEHVGRFSAIEAFALALLIGLTATGVATILVAVPLLIAGLIINSISQSRQRTMSKIALVALGLLIGTAPCWAHNYLV